MANDADSSTHRDAEPMPTQYPPGVYDVLLGASGTTRLARVLALNGTLPTAPPVVWLPYKEHWFTNAALASLVSSLGNNATIRVKYAADLTNLQVVATELADPALWVWQQIYAKEILSPSDWTSGQPSYATPAFYYAQQSGTSNKRMRMLFEISSSNAKKLDRITWLNVDNTLTNYFVNAAIGTTVSLASGGLPPSVSPPYYYRAP